jgi:hypothetical protein
MSVEKIQLFRNVKGIALFPFQKNFKMQQRRINVAVLINDEWLC